MKKSGAEIFKYVISTHKILLAALVAIFLLLLVWTVPVSNMTNWRITIEYSQSDDGYSQMAAGSYITPQGKDGFLNQMEFRLLDGHYSLSANAPLQTVVLLPEVATAENVTVCRINFFSFGRRLFSISGAEFFEYFQTTFPETDYQLTEEGLQIQGGSGLSLISNEKLQEKLLESNEKAQLPIIKLLLTALIIAFLMAVYWENYTSKKNWRISELLWRFVLLLLCATFIPVAWISFSSPMDVHPDEKVSYRAVEYYETHNGIADVRNPEVEDTFSMYGYSRLRELTPYYFLAGKVSAIVKNLPFVNSYRFFNLMLFGTMLVIALRWGMKYKGLILGLCCTPQLFYLFSYTTSDAWDTFLVYLLLYQIVKEDSCLNLLAFARHHMSREVLCVSWVALISGFLLLSKQNFWFALLFVGVYYGMIWFVEIPQKEKLRYFLCMCAVLMGALFIVGIRCFMDCSVYGMNKAEILTELRTQHTYFTETAATVVRDGDFSGGRLLRGHGLSAWGMVTEKDFFGKLLANACGGFGYWMLNDSSDAVKVLYCIVWGSMLVFSFFRCCLGKASFWKTGVFWLVTALSVMIVFYHAWTSDFQAQSRYLVSCFVLSGVLVSSVKRQQSVKQENIASVYVVPGILGAIACLWVLVLRGMLALI